MADLNQCSVCGGHNVRLSDRRESNLYCSDCGQYVIGMLDELDLDRALNTEQLRQIIRALQIELWRVHRGIRVERAA
jgi:hypothetical protein